MPSTKVSRARSNAAQAVRRKPWKKFPARGSGRPYRLGMNNPLTKREIESLADQLLALIDQIDSGDLRATPGMRHRIEGALIGLDIALGRSLEETLESFRGLDKRAE